MKLWHIYRHQNAHPYIPWRTRTESQTQGIRRHCFIYPPSEGRVKEDGNGKKYLRRIYAAVIHIFLKPHVRWIYEQCVLTQISVERRVWHATRNKYNMAIFSDGFLCARVCGKYQCKERHVLHTEGVKTRDTTL